jgi:hypothetical protein
MRPGGKFWATFFEAPAGDALDVMTHAGGQVVTYRCRDPFHYRREEFNDWIADLPWQLRYIGEWGHPRGQRMLCFERLPADHSMTMDATITEAPAKTAPTELPRRPWWRFW